MEKLLLLKPPGEYSPGGQGTWGIFVLGKTDLQETLSRARNLLSFQIDFFLNYLFTALLTLNESNLAQTFAFALLFAIILLFKNIKRDGKEVFSSPA